MRHLFARVLFVSLAALLGSAAIAALGGFGVSVSMPKANNSHTKGAALIVQPIGCAGPGASISARAEGLVDGQRKSIPLKLTAVPGEADTYMLGREWPAKGAWVLVFTAKKDSMHADSLVQIDRNGNPLIVNRPRSMNWDQAKLLPDGKTRLLACSFVPGDKVVAMHIVAGDLKAAIAYELGVGRPRQ